MLDRIEMDKEFDRRIKHNFKLYVLITTRSNFWQEPVLKELYRLSGYKCHKTVKYRRETSHIHVKFAEEYLAKEAVETINSMNCGITAILMDDMLRNWFIHEIKTGCRPHCSLTIVDIIGNPPYNINFLTSNILSSILQDFGAPYLLPYTAALNEPHGQVVFNSMTEALAACIAFGEWYNSEEKVDSFSYRVRINPSNKEENLIQNCGGTPSEAFKLDYFSNKKEIKTKSNSSIEKGSKNKIALAKGTQKLFKSGRLPILSPESRHINPVGQNAQILYLPIIAASSYNTPVSTSNQFGVHCMTAALNFRQNFSTRSIAPIDNTKTENASQYGNSEEISESKDHKEFEYLSAVPTNSDRIPQSLKSFDKSKKMRVQRGTRIFERSRCATSLQ